MKEEPKQILEQDYKVDRKQVLNGIGALLIILAGGALVRKLGGENNLIESAYISGTEPERLRLIETLAESGIYNLGGEISAEELNLWPNNLLESADLRENYRSYFDILNALHLAHRFFPKHYWLNRVGEGIDLTFKTVYMASPNRYLYSQEDNGSIDKMLYELDQHNPGFLTEQDRHISKADRVILPSLVDMLAGRNMADFRELIDSCGDIYYTTRTVTEIMTGNINENNYSKYRMVTDLMDKVTGSTSGTYEAFSTWAFESPSRQEVFTIGAPSFFGWS